MQVSNEICYGINRNSSVSKGDYVVIKEGDYYFLGEALNFQFLHKTTQKEKRFTRKSCPVNTDVSIGIIANKCWYIIMENCKIMPVACEHYFDIKFYQFHVNPQLFNMSALHVSKDVIDVIFAK